MLGFSMMCLLILALVLIEHIYLIVVIPNISMARIVHVRHVDEEAYLKGNIEPDPDELDLVFERSPTYAKVLEQVRIELNWMDPSDIVELEGRHNAGFWNALPLEDNAYQLRATLGCIQGGGGRISRQGARIRK
jgi:hypothetical protein